MRQALRKYRAKERINSKQMASGLNAQVDSLLDWTSGVAIGHVCSWVGACSAHGPVWDPGGI